MAHATQNQSAIFSQSFEVRVMLNELGTHDEMPFNLEPSGARDEFANAIFDSMIFVREVERNRRVDSREAILWHCERFSEASLHNFTTNPEKTSHPNAVSKFAFSLRGSCVCMRVWLRCLVTWRQRLTQNCLFDAESCVRRSRSHGWLVVVGEVRSFVRMFSYPTRFVPVRSASTFSTFSKFMQ